MRHMLYLLVEELMHQRLVVCIINQNRSVRKLTLSWEMIPKIPRQLMHYNRMWLLTDSGRIDNLRMDRNTLLVCILY